MLIKFPKEKKTDLKADHLEASLTLSETAMMFAAAPDESCEGCRLQAQSELPFYIFDTFAAQPSAVF